MGQVNTFDTLDLHNVMCQLYLKKKKKIQKQLKRPLVRLINKLHFLRTRESYTTSNSIMKCPSPPLAIMGEAL